MALLLPLVSAVQSTGDRRLVPAFEPSERIYNYSPCFVLGDRPGAAHIWYCANRRPGDVTDYLCHRMATRAGRGWKWSEEAVALGPAGSKSDWDSRHVCDPEVIAGRYRYKGQYWRYAMLYLGCDAERSTHNQIGVAFADSLDGPWTRYPNPIVRYTDDPEAGIVDHFLGWPVYRQWGVGQPAAVSLDRKGKLLLFFSRGEGHWGAEQAELDLSDMDRGPLLGPRSKLPTAGLRNVGAEGPVVITNIGVALDERQNRLYMVREGLPNADTRFPGFISAYVQVASIPWTDIRKSRGTWRIIAQVDHARTGWPRNHNATFMKDLWGRVVSSDRLTVAVSVAEAFESPPPDFEWLWTYRMGLVEMSTSEPSSR